MAEHIEHINQLLDGELEPMLESGLYAELAINADLRTELRHQMALRSAVQNDRMALLPPAQLTNSVFSGLGFAAPLAGAAAGAAGGSLLLSWLTRIGIPILSAVAATGVTYFAVNSDPKSYSSQQQQQVTQQTAVAGPEIPVTSAPTTSTVVAPPVERRSSNETARFVYLNNQVRDLEQENASLRDALAEAQRQQPQVVAEPVTENSNIEAKEVPLRNVVVENDFTVRRESAFSTIRQGELPTESNYVIYPAFSAQIRGFALSPTQSISVEEQSEWYSNIGFALFYRLNKTHTVGLEVGNESFPMIFEGDRNGQIVRYEQYPSTMFAGGLYRYTGGNIGRLPFAPFGQVFAGGSTFGPVGRAAFGLEYSPTGPLTFILAAEASAMAYKYQNTWYTSPKFGLTYGMSFRF